MNTKTGFENYLEVTDYFHLDTWWVMIVCDGSHFQKVVSWLHFGSRAAVQGHQAADGH